MAQKILENKSQASSSSEMTVKPDNSKSLLANNKSNPRKKSISAEFLSDTENDIPVIYSPKAMREVFCKHKQSINKLNTAKKQSKKIKTNAKLLKETLKPTKLHLLRNNNLATRVKHEKIKWIFKRELVFGTTFFKLHTVLQVLQETDFLAQKVCAKATIDGALLKRMENLQLPEPEPSDT